MNITMQTARHVVLVRKGRGYNQDWVDRCRAVLAGKEDPLGKTGARATVPEPPRSSVPSVQPSDPVLLGTLDAGEPVFSEDGMAEFWLRCKTLTPTGEKVRDRLIAAGHAPLTSRAKELGINVPAVLEAARSHKVMGRLADPLEALKGEIALQEAVQRAAGAAVRGL